jgi:serine/threonine-protein kinase RsbW
MKLGGTNMKNKTEKFNLKIPSVTENLYLIREFIIKIAIKAGFDDDVQEQIALAVDEACTNVIKHAHKFDATRAIDINVALDSKKMIITIIDKGEGFDINKLQTPDLKKFAKESRHGGLGIYLMKTLMDDVKYEFNPGKKNQVQLTKYYQPLKSA